MARRAPQALRVVQTPMQELRPGVPGWYRSRVRSGATLLLLVIVACGRSGSTGAPPEPGRGDAGVATAVIADAAARAPAGEAAAVGAIGDGGVDLVSGATLSELDGGAPVVLPERRTIEVRAPLRGKRDQDAPVWIGRGDAPAALLGRAFADLRVDLPAGAHVVVKINLGGYDRIKKGSDDGITGRTTSPALLRALLVELRRRGATDLVVADGPSEGAAERDRALAATGIGPLLAELEVPFVDLNHYGDDDSRPAPWRIRAPWAVHLRDELVLSDELVRPGRRVFLIDVPKIKTHRFAVMSLSIKNLMGAVGIAEPGATPPPWQRRWRMHRELAPWLAGWRAGKHDDRAQYRRALAVFSQRLADLWGILTPDLVVLDGFPAVEGDGFQQVPPFESGVLIASRNGCYADFVAAQLYGLDDSDALEAEVGARMPPAIAAVAERYYGGVDRLRRIEVRGDVDWRDRPGRTAWFKAMAPFQIGAPPR